MTGTDLRDQGFDAVMAADHAVHRNVGPIIKSIIEQLAETGEPFTAEDVRAALPEGVVPHSPNLIPAYFGSAAHRGLITAISMYRPTRASRRSSRNLVWKGAAA